MVKNDYDDEFPLLHSHGLYAAPISGDGNCLFHALSDQLYGHENNHRELRASIVNHIRQHSSYFKLFLSVPGATSKKTKSGKNDYHAPSESAIDDAFEQHLKRMSQQGVYGDNIEICAFAREFGVDVKIYQREFAYVVQGDGVERDVNWGGRKMVHIAYHTWEHYSSIRNIAGPHTGLPEVKPVMSTEDVAAAGEGEGKQKKRAGKYALPWMVDTVMKSLPFLTMEEEVTKELEECKGDVYEAVGRMLDKEMEIKVGEGCEENSAEEKTNDQVEEGLKEDGGDATATAGEKSLTPPPTPPRKGPQGGPKKQPQKKQKAATAPTASTTDNIPPKPAAAQTTSKGKAKRQTARERKERQKVEAAERKRNKGIASSKGDSKAGNTTTNGGSTNGIEGGIRELYI